MKRTRIKRKTPLRSRSRRHEPAVEREPHAVARLERMPNYSGTTSAKPKEPQPIRDESYRRWVATLPCYECRIEGYTQCAHPNSGKAKGRKQSDAECFPLCCTRPGVKGCHARFDQYELVPREAMPQYEREAAAWTKEQRKMAT